MTYTRWTTSARIVLLGLSLICAGLAGCGSKSPETTSGDAASSSTTPPVLATPVRPASPKASGSPLQMPASTAAAEPVLAMIEAAVDRRVDGAAQGNMDEARDFAKKYVEEMASFDQRIVGPAVDRTTHGDTYRAWCELHAGTCLFIVNVPAFGDLTNDIASLVRNMAYERASTITRDKLKVGDRLAVELRSGGALVELMTGTVAERGFAARESFGRVVADRKLLLPYVPVMPSGFQRGIEGARVDMGNGRTLVIGKAVKPGKPPRKPKPGPISTEADVRLALEDLQPDANFSDRGDAIERLTKVSAPLGPRGEVTAALLALSTDRRYSIADQALTALGVWGDAATAETLKANMASIEGLGARRIAFETIGKLQGAEALEFLLEAAKRNPSDKGWVSSALQKFPPEAEEKIAALLESGDDQRRSLACSALGRMGSSRSLPALRKVAESETGTAKLTARAAISQIELRENRGK